jgi:hypothetical protein
MIWSRFVARSLQHGLNILLLLANITYLQLKQATFSHPTGIRSYDHVRTSTTRQPMNTFYSWKINYSNRTLTRQDLPPAASLCNWSATVVKKGILKVNYFPARAIHAIVTHKEFMTTCKREFKKCRGQTHRESRGRGEWSSSLSRPWPPSLVACWLHDP